MTENIQEIVDTVKGIKVEGKNKGAKLTFLNFIAKRNDKVVEGLLKDEIMDLIQLLEKYNTKIVTRENKAYSEEISICRNEVERSLFLMKDRTGKKLRLCLTCYTDKDNDDNWIILTPAKLNYFIGLLYGYYDNL